MQAEKSTLEDDESQVRDQITTCTARSDMLQIDKETNTEVAGNTERNTTQCDRLCRKKCMTNR